tara:strand:+ start:592 stop:789 length:198 start_codon:yes stop_codon:yes gene_type:complete
VTKAFLLFKNNSMFAKWLPLLLAISLVFVPNSLILFKLLGVIFSIFLFYRAINNHEQYSSRDFKK